MTHAELLAGLLRAGLWLSLAVVGVAALRPLVRRLAGAEAQYQLWLLVPAVLLALGLASSFPPQATPWQMELGEVESFIALVAPAAEALNDGATARSGTGWSAPLLGLWALGGALVAALLLRAQRGSQRAPVVGAALSGAWAPTLRLPPDFRQRFTPAQRRLILLHERIHAERGDTRWLLLATSLGVLQWFNPLAWWALSRLRADMELACDAAVLRRRPSQLRVYRQALLQTSAPHPSTWPCATTALATHPLVERIAMLPQHRNTSRPGLIAALVLACSTLAYATQPAVQSAARPESPSPAVAVGYSKLRLDLQMSVNGQALAPVLLLDTFNSDSVHRFDESGISLRASGTPYRDASIASGEEVLMLSLTLWDNQTGEVLARPRLASKDGVMARVEFGEEGQRRVRIDLLPRVVQTRLHDGTGARHELLRDIEAGKAPANHFLKR